MNTKVYGVYCFVKFTTVASILLYFAITRKDEVDNYYSNASICQRCYNRSQTDTDTLYEFGRCHEDFLTDIDSSNLMVEQSRWTYDADWSASNVHNYVRIGATLFCIVVLVAAAMLALPLYTSDDDGDDDELLVVMVKMGLCAVVLCNMIAYIVFFIYKDGDCYISALDASYNIGGAVMFYAFWAFYLVERCSANEEAKRAADLIQYLFLFGYALLTVIATATTSRASGNTTPVLLTSLLFASLFEVPLALFGTSWLSMGWILELMDSRRPRRPGVAGHEMQQVY